MLRLTCLIFLIGLFCSLLKQTIEESIFKTVIISNKIENSVLKIEF